MHFTRTFILLFTFVIPLSALAQEDYHSKEEIEGVLVQLDHLITEKMKFQGKRQTTADSLEAALKESNPKQYVKKCQELFYAVNDYDGKRSLEALHLIEETNDYKNDVNLRAWVMLNRADVYGTMGLYHKARFYLTSVSPRQLSKQERLHYYHTSRSFYERISEYVSDDDVVEEEEDKMVVYYDSILALEPAGIGRDIVTASKDLYVGDYEKGLRTIRRDLKEAKGKEIIYLYATIAALYKELGNKQNYIYYLALTSIGDIKNGTTEYQALPYLVQALYDEGDTDRAYAYLMCAMEDANFFPARNLAVKVSSYFPLVSQAYDKHQAFLVSTEKMKRNSLAVTYAMLALAICVAFYLGWRYNNTQDQKRRADELQKALDKASIADRIKTVFIQNMRHEIRTPLNAIMGFAQLMSNDLTDEERSLYNGYIQENNNQLLYTLDNIIDVSNMEVGTFNFKFEDVDVDALCRKKIEDCQELLPGGVEFIYSPAKENAILHTDKTRIGQVLYNLLSNACKNTTEGVIRLNVAHSIANDSIQFVVADTGVGVPPDKSEVIFEHFEKLDHYSPGLGLGLYVCRLIARALGGDIYLDTSYTGGARFVFTVPNAKEGQLSNNEQLMAAKAH